MDDQKQRLKIAFLTALDPQNRHSWSGTVYYIAQSLQKHCGELFYIGPINPIEELIGKVIHKTSQFFLNKNYRYYNSFAIAGKYAKFAMEELQHLSVDVIVAPSAGVEISMLETSIPIVLIEDATFGLLHNYYPQYSNLLKRSISVSNALQQQAIQKASLLIYSSEWAARSAIDIYHADEQKVHVIPFGANFDAPPSKEIAANKKKSDQCKLLFIGVNWQRKGGDIAFETLIELEKMGIQAELIVCGCIPPKEFSHQHMKVIPFLNKNDATQRKQLENLFVTSDFMLLPTRRDCTPIVFCEASSYGLPVITTSTGGVPGVITDGENGFMLPLEARGAAYAELIAKIYSDGQRYFDLVQSSRTSFENHLNWDSWGESVRRLLEALLEDSRVDRNIIATRSI